MQNHRNKVKKVYRNTPCKSQVQSMEMCPVLRILLFLFNECKTFFPVFSAFCYISLIPLPFVIESILLSEERYPIHVILFCSRIQIVLSAYAAFLLGYTLNRKNCAHGFLDDIYRAKPTQLISFLSPVYIIYIGVPWFVYNLLCFYEATERFCFPKIIVVHMYTPVIVFIPFFVAGVALYEVHSKSDDSNNLNEPKNSKTLCDASDSKISDVEYKKEECTEGVNDPHRQRIYKKKPRTVAEVVGSSSKTIFEFMTYGHVHYEDNPMDVHDYERNRALLICYPEWRRRMNEMEHISKEWGILVNYWDAIEFYHNKDFAAYGKIDMRGDCNKFIELLLESSGA